MSKARQAKTEHMEMKISQPIFGILVVLTKNELTKICNEPGINVASCFKYDSTQMSKSGSIIWPNLLFEIT